MNQTDFKPQFSALPNCVTWSKWFDVSEPTLPICQLLPLR
jgi:hypothetical protein